MLNDIMIPVLIFLGLGLVAGILLSVFSKIFAVDTDENTERIVAVLPGLNCGVCGFNGCENYAKEMVHNDVPINKCIPGGDKTAMEISRILGREFQDVTEQIAVVHCGGKVPKNTSDSYIYAGEKSCAACNMYYQGKGVCDYGCIGYGDCVKECEYGAVSIVDEVAVINPSLCRGCAMCAAACPKSLIALQDADKKVYISCHSCNPGRVTAKLCQNGCIACKKCEKTCPTGAIKVDDNLAAIDYEKCINCLECAACCPRKCIQVSRQ